MHNAKICYAELSLAQPDVPKSEPGGFGIFRSSNDLVKQRRPNLRIGEHLWYVI
jgi:hypothetical protein